MSMDMSISSMEHLLTTAKQVQEEALHLIRESRQIQTATSLLVQKNSRQRAGMIDKAKAFRVDLLRF